VVEVVRFMGHLYRLGLGFWVDTQRSEEAAARYGRAAR
jgi:hypothetical protein